MQSVSQISGGHGSHVVSWRKFDLTPSVGVEQTDHAARGFWTSGVGVSEKTGVQASGWQCELCVRSSSFEELKCLSAGGWLRWIQEVWNSHRVKCCSRRRRSERLMCAVSWLIPQMFPAIGRRRQKHTVCLFIRLYKKSVLVFNNRHTMTWKSHHSRGGTFRVDGQVVTVIVMVSHGHGLVITVSHLLCVGLLFTLHISMTLFKNEKTTCKSNPLN